MAEDFGWGGDEFFLGVNMEDHLGWAQSTNEFWADRMSEDEPDDGEEWEDDDESPDGEEWDCDDVEWDAEVLASAGHGTDEDYGLYSDGGYW